MKKIDCFLLSTLMVLSLSGCGKKTVTPPQSDIPPVVSETSSATETPKTENLTLHIGTGKGVKEVSCIIERTPEAAIAALAEETGWNLPIKSITTDLPKNGCLTIAFAVDSSIYTDPPDTQKEAYHVFDAEDWVPTVLNSVAETLNQNFDIGGVAFASADGGDLEAGNKFLKFHFNSKTLWDYESVLQSSKPENVSDATTLIRKMMESRGETGSVIIEGGEEVIDGERCLTFMIGNESIDGDAYTASYHYAVSDTNRIWTIDILEGPNWVLLDAS